MLHYDSRNIYYWQIHVLCIFEIQQVYLLLPIIYKGNTNHPLPAYWANLFLAKGRATWVPSLENQGQCMHALLYQSPLCNAFCIPSALHIHNILTFFLLEVGSDYWIFLLYPGLRAEIKARVSKIYNAYFFVHCERCNILQ